MNKTNFCLVNEVTTSHCPRCRVFGYIEDKLLTMEQTETADYHGGVHYALCKECEAKEPVRHYCPGCDNHSDELALLDLLDLPEAALNEAERNDGEIVELCSTCDAFPIEGIPFAGSPSRYNCRCGGDACPACNRHDYI